MLTPTRELCIQVTQALRTYGKRQGIDPVAVFGGAPIRTQQAQLKAGGADRRRHRRPRARPDLAPLAVLHALPLRRPRRGRRDARPRLPRGRREDPLAHAERPPDRALQRDDAAARSAALAERHLYDPVTVKVKSATLTIDTVEQFFVEVKQAEKTDDARRGARGRAARPGDRLRPHEDPLRAALPHAARPRHERQGAARRHDPGRPRRRDDLLQGRPPDDPRRHRRRRPRARHLDASPTSSTSTSRRRPTSTCTASGARAASAARAARSRSSSRARRATSRRSRSTRTPRSRRGRRARTSPRPRWRSAAAPAPQAARRAVARQRRAPHADRLGRPRRGARRGAT